MSSQLQLPSRLNDGGVLDTTSQAMDMSLYSRSQDLVGINVDSNMISGTFSTNQPLLNSYGQQIPADPLHQWYHRNDGPWIPQGIAPPEGQNGANARNNGLGFSGPYRDSISPSECDTAPLGLMPSDSGYGSYRPKHSVATASISYDEPLDSHETRSLVGTFATGMDPSQWSQTQPQHQAQTAVMQRTAQPEGKELICGTCQKVLKTNSEFKKHQQRHTKPHICNITGCTRTDGFSTSNDLDRHKRSCHADQVATGTFYRCNLGACRNKDKIWPRADNFRAHIKRVHRRSVTDDEMEKLIHRPSIPQDVLLPDLAGMQQSSEEYNVRLSPDVPNQFSNAYWQQGPNSEMTTSVSHSLNSSQLQSSLECQIVGSNRPGQKQHKSTSSVQQPHHLPSVQRAEDQQQFVTPGDLNHRTVPYSEFRSIANKRIEPLTSETDVLESPEAGLDHGASPGSKHSTEENAVPEPSDAAIPTTADVSSLVLDLKDPEKIRQILEALQSKGVLKELGYKKEDTPSTDEKDLEATTHRPDTLNYCDIPSCGKSFSRRCELKKHKKRHEKPYGCTYEGCCKRFGSKNDWKRHENSQHFLLEIWKCDVRAHQKALEVCGKVSHRRETFRQHLINNHQLNGEIMEKKLEECRVGRNCEANFWCGFCEVVIRIKSKGVDAWTERYNHIDDHLAGRSGLSKKHMDDWKSVDPESASHSEIPVAGLQHMQDSPAWSRTLDRDTPAGDTVSRLSGRGNNTKRKADGQSGGRPAKRTKSSGIILCCRCGEGNTLSGINPSCIGEYCQHILCHNCT